MGCMALFLPPSLARSKVCLMANANGSSREDHLLSSCRGWGCARSVLFAILPR